MGANFQPEVYPYKETGSFRFWCQKVLPLVYDDSLSYYELLCKVVKYLNDVIANVDGLHDDVLSTNQAFMDLQEFCNSYFDSTDFQSKVNEKLDEMVEDGTMEELLNPVVGAQLGSVVSEQIDDVVASQIGDVVGEQISAVVAEQIDEPVASATTDWLTAHVDPVGSAVIVDDSLHIEGAAADAKVVGDKIGALDSSIVSLADSVYSDIAPFYRINKPMTYRQYVFKNDETKYYESGFTEIMPCPKVLAWNIPSGTSRLYLYIGDMVDGEFVLDTNYIFNTTSGGIYNYMGNTINASIETDGTKYFYYSIRNDEGVEIIGSDYFPSLDFSSIPVTPYAPASNGTQVNLNTYNSVIVPSDCFYIFIYGKEANVLVATPSLSNANTYVVKGNRRFGYITKAEQFGIIRFPNDADLTTLKLYVSKKWNTDSIVGRNMNVNSGISDALTKFKWVSKVAIPWSDSDNTFKVGKAFYGIPYSSRWKDAHHIGIEVSMETALNAANDEYSIFYDLTSGRSVIGSRGGTGYGCVCSSTMCLVRGLPYPQTIQGMTYDANFAFTPSANFKKGDFVVKYEHDGTVEHLAFVNNLYENGYTVFEGREPCTAITTHCGEGTYRANHNTTFRNYLDDYDYVVNLMNGVDIEKQFRSYDFEIANGSVRPWRGNKSVYSNADSFIGVTLHGNVETIYLKKPGGTTVSIEVVGEDNVIDIGNYCDEVGVYELSSNISNVKEYFKYVEHDAVTVSIDSNGDVQFSDDDIEYAYVIVHGFGANTPLYKDIDVEGTITIHKDSTYKGLNDNIRSVVNAMAYDEWGRYPVTCTLAE